MANTTYTYSALYVDHTQWQQTSNEQRFVQRDIWQGDAISAHDHKANSAQEFLSFLRGDEFLSLLSRIFNVQLTDRHVEDPPINTNYFRLGAADFVRQHAYDLPGREVCMLLYLNKEWNINTGGELVFMGKDDKAISITPVYNRCVLFDPSSKGSEHWVKRLNAEYSETYRYNITSLYWTL